MLATMRPETPSCARCELRKVSLLILFFSAPLWAGASSQFDGVNDEFTNLSFPWSGGPVTVVFWNHVASSDLQEAAAFTVGNGDPLPDTDRFECHCPWSDGNVYWDYGDVTGAGRISTSYAAYDDKWTHVGLVSDGGGSFMGIYLDGSLVQSAGSSDAPGSLSVLRVGQMLYQQSPPASFWHKGKISNFRIYGRVLNAAEIKQAMHCANLPANTAVHWNLWAAGDIPDLSGNGWTGTDAGATESSDGPPASWCDE